MSKKPFCLEQYIRIIAGTFVLISVLLSLVVNRWWLAFTVFVGANLLQSAFTGFCPAEMLLQKMGVKKEKDLG